jgi:hypothetical protein
MKVAPDLSGVAALDIWLRAADRGQIPSADSPAAGTTLPSAASSLPQPPRDPAEDLLVLEVRAADTTAADNPAASASVHEWADHIFGPLR